MSRIICVLMMLLVICMAWCDTALAHGPRGFLGFRAPVRQVAFNAGFRAAPFVGFRAAPLGFYGVSQQQFFVPQQQIYIQPQLQPFIGQGFQGYTAPSGGCGQLLIIR